MGGMVSGYELIVQWQPSIYSATGVDLEAWHVCIAHTCGMVELQDHVVHHGT